MPTIDPIEVPDTPAGQRAAKERRMQERDAARAAAGNSPELAAGRTASEVREAKRAGDPVRAAVTPDPIER